MSLLLVNEVHQLLQLLLGLQAGLLSLAGLLGFLLLDDLLLFVGLVDFSCDDVDRDDVFLDAVDHVVVGALEHQLEVVLVLDHRQLVLSGHYHVGLSEQLVLDLVLFVALLLEALLDLFQLAFLVACDLIDVVVLDPQIPQGVADLLLLLVASSSSIMSAQRDFAIAACS